MPEPGWNDCTETAGRAAGGDDQKVVGRGEGGINGVAAIAHHRGLADLGPLAAVDARARQEFCARTVRRAWGEGTPRGELASGAPASALIGAPGDGWNTE